MDCFEIDFENYRARAYEIRPETPFQIIWEATFTYDVDMQELFTEPEFKELNELMALSGRGEVEAQHSQRAEYFARAALAKIPEEDRAAVLEALIPTKGDFELVRPTSQAMDMAVQLLVEHKQPLGTVVHRIARVLGGIGKNGKWIDNLSQWLMLEIKLRKMFEGRSPAFTGRSWKNKLLAERREAELTNYQFHIDVHLVPDTKGHRRLTLKPQDLEEALILHAARKIATGTKFQVCDQCKGAFLTGGTGRRGNKKRADARFCSDPCRWTYNNERRRNA